MKRRRGLIKAFFTSSGKRAFLLNGALYFEKRALDNERLEYDKF